MNKKNMNLFEMLNRIKINSGLFNENSLNEIDWDNEFSDVYKKCINPIELEKYLNNIIDNSKKKPSDRETLGLNKPYIHTKAIPFDEEGGVDINAFIEKITAMPNSILSINSKMEKSKTDDTLSVNIGIPALRGLVYDIDNKQFYFINTCPGAGECAIICYARKGSYVMFPDVFVKQTRILNLLLNYPDRFEKLLKHELEIVALKNPNKEIQFRWNDAGDFFTKKYYQIAQKITKELKSDGYNIKSYAYTKMGDVVNMDDNDITVNFSTDANRKETNKVKDIENKKKEVTIPKELFSDLFVKTSARNPTFVIGGDGKMIYKDKDGVNILKKRIADRYNVNMDTILTYDELLTKPVGMPLQYNVMVAPKGEGDIGAQRRDVKYSFLMFH
jgi:hypothetical protein